jgi:NAD(P)-dependent dehydrogenase (short-subunit alcohol dehydrogenase family)
MVQSAGSTTRSPLSSACRRHLRGANNALGNQAGEAALVEVFDLNLVAAVDLCRLAAPLLFAHPGSTVINVASIYGLVGSRAPMAAYNASKGALVNFTRNLAAQWGERGVRVNALAPGFFPTELTGGRPNPPNERTSSSKPCSAASPTLPRSTAVALPRLGRLELHDRTGPDRGRRVDGHLVPFSAR